LNKLGIIALAGVIGLAGCVDRKAQDQAKVTEKIVSDPAVVVTVAQPQVKTLQEKLEVTGSVTSGDDVQVGAKQSGRLISVFFKDGDAVTAGQVLAIQETSSQQAQLRQALAQVSSARSSLAQALQSAVVAPQQRSADVSRAEAGLSAAKAQLASAKASYDKAKNGARNEERKQAQAQIDSAKSNVDKAKKDLDRTRTLVEAGALAASQLDVAANAYQSALSAYQTQLQSFAIIENGTRPEDLRVAQEAVIQAEANLRSAQQQLVNAQATKQLDVVTREQVQGARAQVQSAEAQVQLIQQYISDATITAPITGRVSGKPAQVGAFLAPGTPVARLVGGDGNYFEGEVSESAISKIAPGASVTIRLSALPNRTYAGRIAAINPLGSEIGRLFKVRIQFLGAAPEVRPGMFATGQIVLRNVPGALVVPSTAVVQMDGKAIVYVLSGTNKVRAVPVTIGLREATEFQVTGVSASDQVVVKGQGTIDEKSTIRVDNGEKATDAPKSVGG
jgi:RND family efflux transporter MFP subunit